MLILGDEFMCGICGWIDFNNNIENEKEILIKMSDTLKKEDQIMKDITFLSMRF